MTRRTLTDREFYERQLDCHGTVSRTHFSMLRRVLACFATDRFDVAIGLIDGDRTILDIGCDRGGFLKKACRRARRAYGLDLAMSRIGVARQSVALGESTDATRPAFIVGNANDGLPFADGAFEVVSALAILEHVFDVYGFLAEIHRVLAPGGVLVLEVPNIAYFKHRIRLLFGRLPVTSSPHGWKDGFGWDGGHLHYFTVAAVRRLLADSGFRAEKVVASGETFGRARNIAVSYLAGNMMVRARRVGD